MSFTKVLKSLTLTSPRRCPTRRPSSARLSVEALEDRCLLSNYIVTDLGPFVPNQINNLGMMVGTGAVWHNGVTIDLGSLGGPGWYSTATEINDAGQVAGFAAIPDPNNPGFHRNREFLITPEDTNLDGVPDRWNRDTNLDGVNDLMVNLGALGGLDSYARCINNAGIVVGDRYVSGSFSYHPWIWHNGVMTDLGTGPGEAGAINDRGQVVGLASSGTFLINPEDTNGDGNPDLWNRDANGDGVNDLMILLPSQGVYPGVIDINAGGQVLSGRLLWTPDTPNGTTGSVASVNPNDSEDDGITTNSRGLNDSGQALGDWWGSEDGAATYAFLWENGEHLSLNSLIDSGWFDVSGTAINEHGWIAGQGVRQDGSSAGILLTPTDLPSISVSDATGTEGSAEGVLFTVTLSNTYSQQVTVNYATADADAVAGSDYFAASGMLTFAPGETTKTIRVATIDNQLYESPEGFRVRLSDPTNAFLTYLTYYVGGSGNIVDDEPVPTASVSSVTALEGDNGATTFAFTVSLSGPSAVEFAYLYASVDGTAWAGSDYQPVDGFVAFAPGQTSKIVAVSVSGDRLFEADESFYLQLYYQPWYEEYPIPIDGAFGVGTIVNDDANIPLVTIGDVTVSEGNTGTKSAIFTVTLSASSSQAVTVNFSTANGSGSAGSDYEMMSGTLTFAPGQTRKTVTVLVNGDRVGEPNETFSVNLSGATNAVITDGQGVGTIVDEEPRISISDVGKTEGKKNQTIQFTFTVTLLAAYDQPVTMSYQTVNGTATTGDNDYIAKSGTLTFAPGETSKTITIEVKGDSKKEADESFYLDLFGNSSNSLFTKNRGLGTILNDD